MGDEMIKIAKAAYKAYASNDRLTIKDLIADDFHFTSPLDNRINRTTYFERCWPNNQSIEAFNFIHLVPNWQQVFVTYEGRKVDGSLFRNTEIVTVSGQQIVEVEVYFGWNMPHQAPPGGFIDSQYDGK